MSASANYYRLKCEGFVSLRDEFPSVPETWTPFSAADGDEQHVNASGVSLAEVPRCVWIPTAKTMSRAEFRAYIAMLECESYGDAGDAWGTFNKLKGQFERGEGDEEDTEDNNNDEPSATEVEATSEGDADAETAVAATSAAVAVAEAAVAKAETAVTVAREAVRAMQTARAGLTVALKRHRGEDEGDAAAEKHMKVEAAPDSLVAEAEA